MNDILLYGAFGLYCVNMLVGLIAQARLWHFGSAHHMLYFVVFMSCIITIFVSFRCSLLIVAASLVYMPRSRPWTWKHPSCAFVGFVGYVLAIMRIC
ncbi:MAG: hypothetical protein RML40_00600 [Bacteroidota bacterium]|nr:hypothetical protein [Candidatus Kapabacteria bacterium]MDW8219005.1 hypothetical protein [Bacteroidota bacterium]